VQGKAGKAVINDIGLLRICRRQQEDGIDQAATERQALRVEGGRQLVPGAAIFFFWVELASISQARQPTHPHNPFFASSPRLVGIGIHPSIARVGLSRSPPSSRAWQALLSPALVSTAHQHHRLRPPPLPPSGQYPHQKQLLPTLPGRKLAGRTIFVPRPAELLPPSQHPPSRRTHLFFAADHILTFRPSWLRQ
jgi:hypothetical protein